MRKTNVSTSAPAKNPETEQELMRSVIAQFNMSLFPVVGRPRQYSPCERSKSGNHVFNEFDICRCGEERPPLKTVEKLLAVLEGQKQYRVLFAVRILKAMVTKTCKRGSEHVFVSPRRSSSSR